MTRVVVVPATPLLVRGASGRADPLGGLRGVVRGVLTRELDAGGPVVVLGTGSVTRAGRLRPTLGAAGIADAQVPLLAGLEDAAWDGLAATGASVALLALADAGLDLVTHAVDVVEVPAEAASADVRAVVARVRDALAGPGERTSSTDGLLVVADHPAPGADAVVEALTAVGHWTTDAQEVPQRHEHLPASYTVAVHRLTR